MKKRPFTWGHVAGGVLLLAGMMKLLAFSEFSDSLRTWTMLPSWLQGALAVGVPPFEIGLGTALLCSPRSKMVLAGFIATMVVFTGAYTLQLFVFGKPQCACLGLLAEYSKNVSDSPYIIGRNVALASVGIVGWIRASEKRG